MLLQVGFTVGYVVSVPFMGHVGRRPQYFVSSILLATAMVVLGASLYALVSVRALQDDTSETAFLKNNQLIDFMKIVIDPEQWPRDFVCCGESLNQYFPPLLSRRVPMIPRW